MWRVYRVCAARLRSKAVQSDTGDGNLPCAVLPSLPSPTHWKAFVCVIFRVTVTVTGDGNSRTVSRFVPALFSATSYPSRFPKTPHRAAWRRCEHKCRGVSQSSPNNRTKQFKPRRYAVCVVRFLFVLCSFWKSFWKLANALNTVLVRSVRWKKEIPLTCKINQKMWSEEFLNVVKFYTLGFLLPIIYIGALERVLFFHQCAAQGPCDRRTDRIR